jgi:hypothetical protein
MTTLKLGCNPTQLAFRLLLNEYTIETQLYMLAKYLKTERTCCQQKGRKIPVPMHSKVMIALKRTRLTNDQNNIIMEGLIFSSLNISRKFPKRILLDHTTVEFDRSSSVPFTIVELFADFTIYEILATGEVQQISKEFDVKEETIVNGKLKNPSRDSDFLEGDNFAENAEKHTCRCEKSNLHKKNIQHKEDEQREKVINNRLWIASTYSKYNELSTAEDSKVLTKKIHKMPKSILKKPSIRFADPLITGVSLK